MQNVTKTKKSILEKNQIQTHLEHSQMKLRPVFGDNIGDPMFK